MAAPSPAYKSQHSTASDHDTAVNPGGHANGKRPVSEEEDRFVTDDVPLRPAPSRTSAAGQGLIVSARGSAADADARSQTVQPLRRSECVSG